MLKNYRATMRALSGTRLEGPSQYHFKIVLGVSHDSPVTRYLIILYAVIARTMMGQRIRASVRGFEPFQLRRHVPLHGYYEHWG